MKRLLFLVFGMFIPILLFGNMGPQGFHAYPNRVFVETGTFRGDGVWKALDAGFKEIHTMDINKDFVKRAKSRFKRQKNVHVYLKDSGKDLSSVIASIKEPITFWLDAHNGFPDPKKPHIKNCPLLEELEQIKKHPIKTHTILIDDLHCCGTLYFDYITFEQLASKILEINPHYRIYRVPGGDRGEYPENVLVAIIE